MDKIKVAIADDNAYVVDILQSLVEKDDELELVGMAENGKDIRDIIKNEKPDIVLLDIIMPKEDGLTAMERVNEDSSLEKRPAFIIVSAVNEEKIIGEAFGRGACYYILKPFDNEAIIKRIKSLKYGIPASVPGTGYRAQVKEQELENAVTDLMFDLGIPAHIKGYRYMRDAIIMVVKDPDILSGITKVLYPAVAKKHKTTAMRVERAIRHAIEAAWVRGNVDTINKVFGYTVNSSKGRPTNAEFIALLADRLRMGHKQL